MKFAGLVSVGDIVAQGLQLRLLLGISVQHFVLPVPSWHLGVWYGTVDMLVNRKDKTECMFGIPRIPDHFFLYVGPALNFSPENNLPPRHCGCGLVRSSSNSYAWLWFLNLHLREQLLELLLQGLQLFDAPRRLGDVA